MVIDLRRRGNGAAVVRLGGGVNSSNRQQEQAAAGQQQEQDSSRWWQRRWRGLQHRLKHFLLNLRLLKSETTATTGGGGRGAETTAASRKLGNFGEGKAAARRHSSTQCLHFSIPVSLYSPVSESSVPIATSISTYEFNHLRTKVKTREATVGCSKRKPVSDTLGRGVVEAFHPPSRNKLV